MTTTTRTRKPRITAAEKREIAAAEAAAAREAEKARKAEFAARVRVEAADEIDSIRRGFVSAGMAILVDAYSQYKRRGGRGEFRVYLTCAAYEFQVRVQDEMYSTGTASVSCEPTYRGEGSKFRVDCGNSSSSNLNEPTSMIAYSRMMIDLAEFAQRAQATMTACGLPGTYSALSNDGDYERMYEIVSAAAEAANTELVAFHNNLKAQVV